MTEVYTFCEDTVSDLHKDAFGFRPSQNWWGFWNSCTDAEKQQEWDKLCDALERSIEREKEDEKYAIEKFEGMIAKSIAAGAKDKETAMRWAMEASDANGDWDYFAWLNGLPYSYVQEMK